MLNEYSAEQKANQNIKYKIKKFQFQNTVAKHFRGFYVNFLFSTLRLDSTQCAYTFSLARTAIIRVRRLKLLLKLIVNFSIFCLPLGAISCYRHFSTQHTLHRVAPQLARMLENSNEKRQNFNSHFSCK